MKNSAIQKKTSQIHPYLRIVLLSITYVMIALFTYYAPLIHKENYWSKECITLFLMLQNSGWSSLPSTLKTIFFFILSPLYIFPPYSIHKNYNKLSAYFLNVYLTVGIIHYILTQLFLHRFQEEKTRFLFFFQTTIMKSFTYWGWLFVSVLTLILILNLIQISKKIYSQIKAYYQTQ